METKPPEMQQTDVLRTLWTELQSTAGARLGAHRSPEGRTVISAGGQVDHDRRAGVRRLLLCAGWACEQRILLDGRRQIFSLLVPGDPLFFSSATSAMGRSVTAITTVELLDVQTTHRGKPSGFESALAQAVDEEIALREARLFDQVVRLGRQSANMRVAHFFLEIYERLNAVDLAPGGRFRLPVTQELFSDLLGLSVVHTNRILKQLRLDRVIHVKSGFVTLLDFGALQEAAGIATSAIGPLLEPVTPTLNGWVARTV